MSYRKEAAKEHPSAYFVQDRSNKEEMLRLEIQDKMLTTAMGGVLPELTDQAHLRSVLDVGCGTGDWLIETALTYPTIERLVGADISGKMLAHARTKAQAQQLDERRVQFQTMDALRALQFPAASFDLVNQRLGASWLRRWEWRKILVEYHRVTRAGGIVRITESGAIESSSPALTKLNSICLEATYNSGRLFREGPDGLTSELPLLLTQHAFDNVRTHIHCLVYRAGTIEGQQFYEDVARFYRIALPFLHKYIPVPDNYQEMYQQALKEMQQRDFVATWTFLTVWGTRSFDVERLLMRGLP